MRAPEIPSDPDRVACNVCFKEIPLSEAVNRALAISRCLSSKLPPTPI